MSVTITSRSSSAPGSNSMRLVIDTRRSAEEPVALRVRVGIGLSSRRAAATVIASSTDDAARQASNTVMTQGAMATTPMTHSGTPPASDVSARSSTVAYRNAMSEAMPTNAMTTGTHIHCATRTVYPPT